MTKTIYRKNIDVMISYNDNFNILVSARNKKNKVSDLIIEYFDQNTHKRLLEFNFNENSLTLYRKNIKERIKEK